MKLVCECGCKDFIGHQAIHCDIVVDEDGVFTQNIPIFDDNNRPVSGTENLERNVYFAGKPFGPFTCMACGAEIDEEG